MKNIKIKINNNSKHIIESETEFTHIRIVKKSFSNELDTVDTSLTFHNSITNRLSVPMGEKMIINSNKKFDILNHVKHFKQLDCPYYKFEIGLMKPFSSDESFVEIEIEYEQAYKYELTKFRMYLN